MVVGHVDPTLRSCNPEERIIFLYAGTIISLFKTHMSLLESFRNFPRPCLGIGLPHVLDTAALPPKLPMYCNRA